VKSPAILRVPALGLLPPPEAVDDIDPPVTIDITGSEAVASPIFGLIWWGERGGDPLLLRVFPSAGDGEGIADPGEELALLVTDDVDVGGGLITDLVLGNGVRAGWGVC